MDIRKVKKLIELLEESGIAEIEIKEGEEAVRISRMPTGALPSRTMHHLRACRWPRRCRCRTAAAAAAPPKRPPRKPRPNEHVVTAPMVGTFYASPSPGREAVRRDRR